jgi:acetyl-CoA synthetase
MFEGVPTYPDAGRFWDIVQQHKITQLYTAPTAIRTLRKAGDKFVTKYDRSSLRILGSVGEPINPEAWLWYYDVCGNKQCSIVDTYWQTETGSIIMTPLPGAIATKPGSCTVPFFGIEPELIDVTTSKPLHGNDKTGVLCVKMQKGSWPSLARTVLNNHTRYLETYFKPYPGYYFTGDGATRDKDGYYWIRGRVDDVINVSGHRISTSEVEAALVQHPAVAESAGVGVNDEVTGQAIVVFVVPKTTQTSQKLAKELINHVRSTLGPFAQPKRVILCPDLPKTRSGKIMRRILRKVVTEEQDWTNMFIDCQWRCQGRKSNGRIGRFEYPVCPRNYSLVDSTCPFSQWKTVGEVGNKKFIQVCAIVYGKLRFLRGTRWASPRKVLSHIHSMRHVQCVE